jgi:hypothetical protein
VRTGLLEAGDASDGTVDVTTCAVVATCRRGGDALRRLALVRLVRGEWLVPGARGQGHRARSCGARRCPSRARRRMDAVAIGLPGPLGQPPSSAPSGPLADALRNMVGRVPGAVACWRSRSDGALASGSSREAELLGGGPLSGTRKRRQWGAVFYRPRHDFRTIPPLGVHVQTWPRPRVDVRQTRVGAETTPSSYSW